MNMSLSKRRSPSGKSQDFAKSFGSLDRPVRKQLCSQTRIESSNRLKIQLHRGNAGSNDELPGGPFGHEPNFAVPVRTPAAKSLDWMPGGPGRLGAKRGSLPV